MACRLLDSKPLPEPVITHCQLDPLEEIFVKFESNTKILTQQNAFENVAAIFQVKMS